LFSTPTIAGIARVFETKCGNVNPKDTNPLSPIAPFIPEEEIKLPEDIRGATTHFNTFDFSNVSKAKHILLTGATGFLGAFVLAELLKRTSGAIHCLIRVSEGYLDKQREKKHQDLRQAARSKLRANLEKYQLFPSKDYMRISEVVVGDLEKPKIGIGDHEFNHLGDTIDAIYHCGAYVHSLYPYSKLRNANVCGTTELLRLASINHSRPIPFFYVSSLSVFPGNGDIIHDDSSTYELPLSILAKLGEGYAQTKVIAERLVIEVR
jgi:thioester reductase-like protein